MKSLLMAGGAGLIGGAVDRDQLLLEDLADASATAETLQAANPALVLHLAAESHVHRPIDGPGAVTESNVIGSLESLADEEQAGFRHGPEGAPHSVQIAPVKRHPGNDRRYAMDSTRISKELGLQARHGFENGLAVTVNCYLANLDWCEQVREWAAYANERMRRTNADTASSTPS